MMVKLPEYCFLVDRHEAFATNRPFVNENYRTRNQKTWIGPTKFQSICTTSRKVLTDCLLPATNCRFATVSSSDLGFSDPIKTDRGFVLYF